MSLPAPILVTGATGNLGRAALHSLATLGIPARAGVRDLSQRPGHDAVVLDFERPETFAPSVVGVGGLVLVRPPPIADVGPTLCALVDAAMAAGVRRVVFLSVIGADRRGYIPHAKVERHLRAAGADWTFLRAGFFAQNLGDAYRTDICERCELFVPAGDGRAAFVDVRDIGEVAARAFIEPGHVRVAHTLTGPEALTFTEVAALLTAALGREIRYTRPSVLAYVRRLRRRGLPWGQIAVQSLLHVGLRFGQARNVDPTLHHLLGRPARTLVQYIADHRALWSQQVP
ncbi:MAG: NmrA family NAD(P)-binding protein [Myxococcales bacterium]|nr:NmrA family NAD(P)-binding protein [Myxococcales bacterium]